MLTRLGLALSEKQMPQVIVIVGNPRSQKEQLEAITLRPRQVRYQAALRPDVYCLFILKHFCETKQHLGHREYFLRPIDR